MKKITLQFLTLIWITFLCSSVYGQTTVVAFTFENGTLTSSSGSTGNTNVSFTAVGTGMAAFSSGVGCTQEAIANQWTADDYWVAGPFNTTGFTSLNLSFIQSRFANSATGNFSVEYSLDSMTWVAAAPTNYAVPLNNACAPVYTATSVALPAATENAGTLYLRWRLLSGSGNGGSRMDNISVQGTAAAPACDIAITSVNTTPPTCPGGTDGSVTINATCTTCTGLEYSLDNVTFQPGNTFTRGAGAYTAYVRDTGDATCNASQATTVAAGVDNTAPAITCPADQMEDADATCMFTVPDYTGLATATDNCNATPTVTQSPAAGTMVALGDTTITLTANDGNGQTTDCTFTLTVEDNTAPAITCPADQTEDADATCMFAVPDYTGMATATDNCNATPTVTQSPAAGTMVALGDTTITLTADDGNGQTTDCSFTLTVEDNTAPAITCPADQTEDADATCMFAVPDYTGMATATDNCNATPTVTQSPAAGTMVALGDTTITLTADDGNGQTTDCSFTLTVEDNTAPAITCPADQTEDADATCMFAVPDYTGMATATDNCNATPTVTQSPAAGTMVALGDTTITLTADDGNGQTTDCSFTLTVEDNTAPVITCPADQTEDADATCMFSVPDYTGMATATDNCNATPTVTQSPAAGTMVALGDTTITLTADDGNGQTTDCTFTLTVEDNTAPVITCPADQTEDADTACMFAVPDYTGMATATDNCNASPTVTQSPAAGTMVALGDTTITLTADDGNGQTTDCSFTLTVEDNTAPAITCPADQTEDADATCMFAVPDYTGMATATDNCNATPTVTQSPAAGTMVALGDTTITLTADDGNGQTTDCTFTLTVEDNTAPVITCPADQTEDADATCMFSVPDYTGMATATDNCNATPTVTQSPAAGTMVALGDTTITLTANDGNGQTTDCTFTLTVEDNEDPVASCVDVTIELDIDGNASIVSQGGGGQGTPVTSVSGSLDVTDSQFARPDGNGTTCTTTTGADHFYDIFAFSIDAADMYTFSMPDNVGPDFYFLLYEGGFDPAAPCQNFIEGNDDTNGTEPELNLTLNLVPGNYELVTTTFFSNAVEGPYTYSVSSAGGGNVFEAGTATNDDLLIDGGSTDNCDIDSIVASQTDFTCADIGENTVTLTVTDVNGNVSMCTAIVTVVDITPVVVTSGPVDIFTGTGPNAGDCETVINYDPVTADSFTIETDNCDDVAAITVVQTAGLGSGASFPVGTTVEEYTLTDASGNETVYTFEVNITDTTLPVIDCPNDDVIVEGDDEGNYMVEDYASIVSDNCSSGDDLVITQDPAAGTVVTDPSTTEVTVTATDEAGNTTTCVFNLVVDETLGVNELSFKKGIVLYPNPTEGQVTVSATQVIDMLSVYDLRGRLVSQQVVGALSTAVNMTSFEAGVYLVNITSGTAVVTKRVIKQ